MAEYILSERRAEGFRGRCVCRDCHDKVMDAEAAYGQLTYAVSVGRYGLVHNAVTRLGDLKWWVGIRIFEDSIDLVRNKRNRHLFYPEKVRLTKYLLEAYGDNLNATVKADNETDKEGMAKVSWVSGKKWCCHIPANQLTGRFYEMYLATAERGP